MIFRNNLWFSMKDLRIRYLTFSLMFFVFIYNVLLPFTSFVFMSYSWVKRKISKHKLYICKLNLIADSKNERRRRTELLQFYGAGGKEDTPYDINSKHFNHDMYVQKTIKVWHCSVNIGTALVKCNYDKSVLLRVGILVFYMHWGMHVMPWLYTSKY